MRDSLHGHFVRVGLEVVSLKSSLREVGLVEDATTRPEGIQDERRDDSTVAVSFEGLEQVADFQPSVHLTSFANDVVTWLVDLMRADDAELQWVTSYQLLVDFQNFSGLIGIHFSDRKWKVIEEWSVASGYEFHVLPGLFKHT